MNNSSDDYQITEMSGLRAHLGDLWQAAIRRRCSGRLHESIRNAIERMKDGPREWGDPVYRLRHMKVDVYRGIADLVICYYGVHDLQREVFWSKIVANPLSPLGEIGYTFPS